MRLSHGRRGLTGAAALVAVLGVATACGSSSSGGSNAGSQPPASSGKTITAVETEYMIMLDKTSVPAGTYTFKAENKGSITHALEMDGPGVEDKSTGDISPGSTGTLTVTLKKGSYDVYCPIPGHKAMGMDTHITVT